MRGGVHRIGVVGLGVVSGEYLATLADSPLVAVTAVADRDRSRAEDVARRLPAARALPLRELLASEDLDVVLNLTVPAVHAEIALGAIGHGKPVYGEKPLAATLAQAYDMVRAAAAADVRLGCAPDTVLGTGTQTARAAIEAGLIGRPLSASAVMVTAGHERWHPNPDFYYREGGGPLLDMGPYYVTALVHLLGPVRRVIGAASRIRQERVIGAGPRAGERIPVEVDSHVSGVLEHDHGVLSTLTTSFDATATTGAAIEVHGEAGSLAVPDPNRFEGRVRRIAVDEQEWTTLERSAGYADGTRGVGLLDFLTADASRPARATGELALHVLEVMTALLESAREGRRIDVASRADRPLLVPPTPVAIWKCALGA